MKGKEIFKNCEVLTEDNSGQVLPYKEENRSAYFSDLRICAEVLVKKYKDIITGLWYIRVPARDGGTQFVFRTKDELTDLQLRNRIHMDIIEFTGHEMCYQITDDSTEGLNSVPISEWVEEGSIYALLDTERGIG